SSSRMRSTGLAASPIVSKRAAKLSIPISIWGLPSARDCRRFRLDRLHLDFDPGEIADQETAGLERHVPVQAEVFAIDLCFNGEARNGPAQWIGSNPVERNIKRDLARLPADGE